MPKNRTEKCPFGLQSESENYFSSDYLSPKRLSSFGFQIELCLGLKGNSFAEIGIGAGFLGLVLRKNNKIYIGIDNHPDLSPNLISVLPFLPIKSNAIDVSMCFQVLEHIPKAMLQDSIMELARITNIGVVISVPNPTPNKLNTKQRAALGIYNIFKFPQRFAPSITPQDEQHFWELGRGVEIQELLECAMNANLKLQNSFRNPLNIYHHFFVFVK